MAIAITAVVGYGATIGMDPAGGTTYVTILEVTSISGGGYAVSTAESTHLASPSGFREFRPGLNAIPEITVTGNWVCTAASQTQISTWMITAASAARIIPAWIITYTDSGAATDAFYGIPTSFTPEISGADSIVTYTLTIQPTSLPVRTA